MSQQCRECHALTVRGHVFPRAQEIPPCSHSLRTSRNLNLPKTPPPNTIELAYEASDWFRHVPLNIKDAQCSHNGQPRQEEAGKHGKAPPGSTSFLTFHQSRQMFPSIKQATQMHHTPTCLGESEAIFQIC